MKFNAFAQLFREKAVGQNSATAVPDATITLYANLAKDIIAKGIVTNVSNGASNFSVDQTANLVADQREYAFPNDLLRNIKVVQAYIGSEWRRVFPFDINTYRLAGGENKPYYGYQPKESFSGATTDETTVAEQFTDKSPKFYEDGKTIVIYSETIDTVAAGLKLKGLIYPKDYTGSDWVGTGDMSIRASSTVTAMPRQSHDVLLMKAVIDYKEVKGLPLTEFEKDYKNQLTDLYKSLSDINDDEAITAITPIDDGFDY